MFECDKQDLLVQLNTQLTDPEVADDIKRWDFELSRTGEGKDTRYLLTLKPGKRAMEAMDQKVSSAWETLIDQGGDLKSVDGGGRPLPPCTLRTAPPAPCDTRYHAVMTVCYPNCRTV